ncbi:hypothetical protein MNBD_GAMMA22-2008 [hydrothermal vent metagenome]|uniref:Uncharacterized protein n=1 Tax=hydrothermal vent metagenome TaxID=652676 RepID=A0A3B1ANN3_9ZZZZ
MVTDYKRKLPNALLNYQYIEEALKQYIYRTDMMSVAEKAGLFDSNADEKFNKAINKIPVEFLVKMFERRTVNYQLIKKLNELPLKTRIISFQNYLSDDNSIIDKKVHKQLLSFENVLQHTENCVHELFVELSNLEKKIDILKARNQLI